MYVWWKEKKTVFLYKEKKKDFLWESTYIKTDWETTLLGHHVELRWRLKVFPSPGFEFHSIKVRFLFFVLEFKVTCYLSWMKYIRDCCFCYVFCIRCKTKFSNICNHTMARWQIFLRIQIQMKWVLSVLGCKIVTGGV